MERIPTAGGEPAVFPPWSTERILVWSFVSFIASFVLAIGLTAVGIVLNIAFTLDLNSAEILYVLYPLVQSLYVGGFFFFLIFKLKQTPFSLSDVWGRLEHKKWHIIIGFLLGMIFMILNLGLKEWSTGQISPPPSDVVRLDWKLLLCAEILAKAVFTGIVEEFFYRGIMYRSIRQKLSTGRAVLTSSFVFSLYHISLYFDPISLFFVFFLGCLAALYVERFQNLLPVICLHIGFNATVSVVYFSVFIIPE